MLGQILAESINGARHSSRSRSATKGRIMGRLVLHFEALSKLSEEEIASAMWDGEPAREARNSVQPLKKM